MERIFAPVGQGCFAIERFSDGVVVFDCGTITKIRNKSCVESISLRIEQEIDSNETIQYVFISHLDEDHVNGLAFLLNKYKVKEVVLPLLYDEYKELYLGKLLVSSEKTYDDLSLLIKQPESFVREYSRYDTRTILVAPVSDEEKEKSNQTICRSGTEFPIDNWVFIPYNYLYKIKAEQLKQYLLDRGINPDDFKLHHKVKALMTDDNILQSIKDAYKKVNKDLNQNSMTVYSGPDGTSCYSMRIIETGYAIKQECNLRWKWEKVACLYTGDYNASNNKRWNDLKKRYRKYWDNIGVAQIPHHGAASCYNENIGKMECLLVINAGTSNQNNHPSPSVLYKLFKTRRTIFWVSEEDLSKVRFEII